MRPIKEIRNLIGKNKIEVVFDELEKRFDNRPLKRDLLISIKNQHSQLKYKNIKGVITYENETIGKNKVVDKLLELISDEKDYEKTNQTKSKKESAGLFKYIFKAVNPKIADTVFYAALAVFIGSLGVYILCVLTTNGTVQSQIIISDWIKEIGPLIGKTLSFSFASLLLFGAVKFKIFNNQFSLSLGECFLYISTFYFLCLIIPLIFKESNFIHLIFLTILMCYGIYRLAGILSYYLKNKSYGDSLIEFGIIIFFVYELAMNYNMFL
ncbi:MAG: hypothetical protein NXI25_26630 [bacterium]|nr:hypothetical protein [bacterium]